MLRISVLLASTAACGTDAVSTGVNPPPAISSQVASVVVAPNTYLLTVGDTVRLVAATRDVSGSPLPGRVVAWSSESPAIATVSASGLVTAVAAGTVRISALSEGTTGTATITATR